MKRQAPIRLLLCAALLSVIAALSGCASGEAHVTVNLDGSADLKVKTEIAPAVLRTVGQEDLPMRLAERLKRWNMTVGEPETEGMAGFTASRHFTREELSGNGEFPAVPGLHVEHSAEKRLFTVKHRIRIEADPLEWVPETARRQLEERLGLLQSAARTLAERQLSLRVAVTLPIRWSDHNADQVADGGRTISWQLSLFEPNVLEMEAAVPRAGVIAAAGGGLLLLLIAGIVVFFRRRKKRSQRIG